MTRSFDRKTVKMETCHKISQPSLVKKWIKSSYFSRLNLVKTWQQSFKNCKNSFLASQSQFFCHLLQRRKTFFFFSLIYHMQILLGNAKKIQIIKTKIVKIKERKCQEYVKNIVEIPNHNMIKINHSRKSLMSPWGAMMGWSIWSSWFTCVK